MDTKIEWTALEADVAYAETRIGRVFVKPRTPSIRRWVAKVAGETIGVSFPTLDVAKRAAEEKVAELLKQVAA